MKKGSYGEVKEEVDLITDGNDMPVDEAIKTLVIGLMMHGVKTTASCGGHSDRDEPYPWVDVDIESRDLLMGLVMRQNRPVLMDGGPNTNIWVVQPLMIDTDRVMPQDGNGSLEDIQKDSETFGQFLIDLDQVTT